MIAVAIIAVLMMGGVVPRWVYFNYRARVCAKRSIDSFDESGVRYRWAYEAALNGRLDEAQEWATDAENFRLDAMHFMTLKRKFEVAMSQPWLPLPNDN